MPDEWEEEHLPIRVSTDCGSLFECLAKDASVPDDRGTALTVASVRKVFGRSRRDQKRSGLMWVPTRVQLADGLTKSSAGVFMRNALTSGTAQLHEESAKVLRRKQLTSSSKEVRDVSVVQMDLEQKLTRDRCTNARVGPSFGTNEKFQTSSSYVHLPSVHRSGPTVPLRGMALV